MTPTRRHLLLAPAVAGLACRPKPRPVPQASSRPSGQPLSRVSVVRQGAYDQGLYETIRRVVAMLGVDARGKRVVLKPNLVEFDAGSVVNTHPLFVHAVLEAFRAQGAAAVTIAEGPGHRRITMDIAEEAGYFRVIPGFADLFTDLNFDRTRETDLVGTGHHSTLRSLHLPVTALGADLLVSLPKMKTHHWVGVTLSMKNLFGLVPGGIYGWPKNVLHWAGIPECIADLYRLFPGAIAIVDGITGMEGNGPIQGVAKQAGVVVAGTNLAAVDATCCRVMGIDPHRIHYLNLADAPRIAEAAIELTAEAPRTVRADFDLLDSFRSLRLKPPEA